MRTRRGRREERTYGTRSRGKGTLSTRRPVRVRGWTRPGEGKTQGDLRRETPLVRMYVSYDMTSTYTHGMILYHQYQTLALHIIRRYHSALRYTLYITCCTAWLSALRPHSSICCYCRPLPSWSASLSLWHVDDVDGVAAATPGFASPA